MKVQELLADFKTRLDPVLANFLQAKHDQYHDFPDYIRQFVDHTAEFTLRGGKRLRPALMYYSYRLFASDKLDEVIKTSIFIELIQSFLLIHDDIMDKADLRRGKATLHKIYEENSRSLGFNDDTHFGNTMAILAGDLACQFAYEIVNGSSFDDASKTRLTGLIAKEISEVIFGQIIDIMLSYQKEFSEAEVTAVHQYKTATYTFRLPMFAGATLAGVDKDKFAIIEKYALPCGIAFQIRDDILGIYGDDENTGKSSTSDIKEGKKTLLVSYAYQHATLEQKQKLSTYLGKADLTDSEANEVRDIFRSSGALNYSQTKCQEHVQRAKEALAPLSSQNNEAYQFLLDLADYMAVRDI